jgi:Carboxypeptidase regulatory-like domain/TonB dependent receptor
LGLSIRQRGLHSAAIVVAASLLGSPAFAQGTAVLTGTVRDAASKAPVAEAVVTVTSPALQGEQTVVTDGSGQYRIPNLPPGTYVIRIDGGEKFRPTSRGGIALSIDTTIRVNTELLPESLRAEEVVVVASSPTVDVGSSSTGVHVGTDFINHIALSPPSGKGAATRSFESLAEVAPGAAADQFGVSISGTTSPENQYVIDGLSVNNPAFGILGTPLSIEFVKEVNVITGGYMPEYGRATGGYLDVVTKTGSNEFHGAVFTSLTPGAFEAHRHDVLREGSTITTQTSLSSMNDFGAQVGGPIVKDKLWFFGGISPSFARFRLDRALNQIRFQNGQPVKDNGFTQTDPIPGTAAAYYATQRSFQFIGKLTWQLNQDNTISLSVYGSPTTSGGGGAFGINPRDGSVEIANANSGGIINGAYSSLAHQYVSSATDTVLKWSSAYQNKHVLFDATLGWHHEENSVRASDGSQLASGKGLSNLSQVFWQRTDPGPHTINDFEASSATAVCDPAGTTMPSRCPVSTYYSGGPGFLTEVVLDRWQGKGVFTGLFSGAGHHVVKGGGDIEVMRYQSSRGYSGSNVYNETTDGTAFTDFRRFGFLVGPDQAVTPKAFEAVSKSTTLGGFVQDSWSIFDKVTLNAGVRYDAQLLYGYDSRLAMTLPNQISPRIGIIYDFTQSGRSKLFANFARFYESVPLDAIDRSIPGERQFTSTHDATICDPRSAAQQQGVCDSDKSRTVQGSPFAPNQKWGVVGSDKSPVDPDIKPQSSDEIVLGGEYELFADARMGIQYTKRYQNRVIEDMSRDEAQTYFIGNPGYGIAKDFPKATRDYDAVTLYFQKSFGDLWLAQASYTASYLRGNWAGLFHPETGQLDPNINSDFDLITLLPNRQGPLPGDHTHSIKIYGAKDFILPGGVLVDLGLTFRTRSGEPATYFGSHPIYGTDQVYILPRGSGDRLPWVHDFDLHGGLGFKLGRESTLMVTMDMFNIFNFQGVIARDQRYTEDSVRPIVNGTPGDLGKLKNVDGTPFNPADKNPNFGNPIAYQAPRTIRLGARVTF